MPNIKVSLKKLRAELDINQTDFAKLIDMPVSTYRKKEAGESPFTIYEAYKIANISNKSVDEIFFAT